MPKKKIILTRHAQERMLKRNVTLEDIRQTLEHATYMSTLKSDNTQEFRRKSGDKENYVVVEKQKGKMIIITVGWS
ncbi:MAG: DUF4258 domain-containing protein [Candidatus Omnitrophota bacterium]